MSRKAMSKPVLAEIAEQADKLAAAAEKAGDERMGKLFAAAAESVRVAAGGPRRRGRPLQGSAPKVALPVRLSPEAESAIRKEAERLTTERRKTDPSARVGASQVAQSILERWAAAR